MSNESKLRAGRRQPSRAERRHPARKSTVRQNLLWVAGVLVVVVAAANFQCPLSTAENASGVAGETPAGSQSTEGATASGVFVAPVTSVASAATSELAPDFSWTDADGVKRSLSEYRGKVVMVNFWATWCPPCRAEMPGIVSLRNDLVDDGVEVIGVAIGERPPEGTSAEAHVAAFAASRGVTYPLVTGSDALADAYGGINAIPTSIIIDRDGRIVETIEGSRDESEFRASIARAMSRP
jgi:thiol-disulfide isomerase/thioredoxin